MVAGAVGCGKSSILSALLGELEVVGEGRYALNGSRLAYASQVFYFWSILFWSILFLEQSLLISPPRHPFLPYVRSPFFPYLTLKFFF